MLDHWNTILRLNLQNDPQAGSLENDSQAESLKWTLRLDHWNTIPRLNLQNDPQAGSLTLDPLAGSHDLGCKVILQSAWKNLFISLCVCLI